MSERGSGLDRIRSMWIMLGAFLVTAVGASLVLLFLEPERRRGGMNEWLILAVVVLAAASALGVLHTRWFSRVPDDAATGVTIGVFLRVAIIELVWIITFVFFLFGAVGGAVLLTSVAAAIGLTMVFAAPTERLVSHLQYQLDAIGAAVDLHAELRKPIG